MHLPQIRIAKKMQKNAEKRHVFDIFGREDEIQTRDLSHPKRAHYQAVLLPDIY